MYCSSTSSPTADTTLNNNNNSSVEDESTKRRYFRDIPIVKFPTDYVQRNDVYMYTEDISYFLGGIIPASDIESLFEEFRKICPKKIKHEQQEVVTFKYKKQSKKRKKKIFDTIKERMLTFQEGHTKSTPRSVIEATRNAERFCFLNAERVHSMFLNALVESESDLPVAFILLRSILDEKIIKSPYKSSIGIHADYPSMEQKQEGKMDIVFPPEFKRSKHALWTIRKKNTKEMESEKKKPSTEEKNSKSATSSTSKPAEAPSSSGKSSEKEEREESLFLPLGGHESSIDSPKIIEKTSNSTTTNNTKNISQPIIPTFTHSLISIGKSVRVLYSMDTSKNNSINLTISIKEYDEAIKATEKQTRNITLTDNRVKELWILDYAFGLSYSGGIAGIPSSQYFNSGLSVVLDKSLQPMLEQIRTKINIPCVPFSESILKKDVKSPQQLSRLCEEMVTDSSDAPSTNTTSASSTMTDNTTDNCPPVNNIESSSSFIIPPTTSIIPPVNKSKSSEEQQPKTNSQEFTNHFTLPDDGKIDLNKCDISITYAPWEEASSPVGSNNDAYSDSHSVFFDDDDHELYINRKRKNMEDPSSSDEEEEDENDETSKKGKINEPEEELEPHHITVLKRLLQFQLIREEDYDNKLKFFQAINEYRSGSLQSLQKIINSEMESLNNFTEYENFICPLSKKFILDPVLATDGLLYDRTALSQWMITFSSVSLLGGCRVTSFTNMPSAVEEINRILSKKIGHCIEFIEQIVEQKVYCIDLIPLIDQVVYYDSTLKRYRRKLLDFKEKIIYQNISTIANGQDRYFDCGKEILELETEKNVRIQYSISMLEKNPNPDYYTYFSHVIYECCNRSINELKQVPNLSTQILNNILTVLFLKREFNHPQFFSSVNIDLFTQPTANHWMHMLILLSQTEAEILASNHQ
ncbi:predicted protein [Naegleria gruberi]|uniref:Predicted protein n=1 Tax=Naegleria gruberi TaxID=5762 RepID=D2VHA8_NAEGR|nr:uncharacterized protein NAEGRDRAFT_68148 [Naegleria gruberi]EFC43769.1 predicted protein [Naegleria gruberi]|eukprot:XP_002676513.1 predicted protein [Naegleria gruberi strain NEG-M]